MRKVISALCLMGTASVLAQDYNATLSKSILYYASATFCDESTLQNWNCGPACSSQPGVGSVTIVSDYLLGTFGFVAYNNLTDTVIVSFRGSYNAANWASDADYFQV